MTIFLLHEHNFNFFRLINFFITSFEHLGEDYSNWKIDKDLL